MDNTKTLATPVTLPCGLVLPNRLVKGPMAEELAVKSSSNRPNGLHNSVYRTWGEGQYGMLVSGNVQVDPRYLGSPGDLTFHPTDLTNPVALSQWETWATACQASGTPAVIQLCHTGRQSPVHAGYRSFFTKSLAPSALPLDMPGGWPTKILERLIFGTPKEMSIQEIGEAIGQFVLGAKLAHVAGFKGVELHAAHGYLLTQFLSPKTNMRTDDYGGTPQKRLRFILRTIAEIRAATNEGFCIGVKLNSADYQTMGISEEEVLAQVTALSDAGVDFIDISGGTYENPKMLQSRENADPIRESTRRREAYFTEFAAKARSAAPKTVIMVTGGFRSREGMATAIHDGSCDLIGIARPTALEPQLPKDKLLNKGVSDKEAVVVPTNIGGGKFFRMIPIVGLGLESVWHATQIKRIALGKKTDPTMRIF